MLPLALAGTVISWLRCGLTPWKLVIQFAPCLAWPLFYLLPQVAIALLLCLVGGWDSVTLQKLLGGSECVSRTQTPSHLFLPVIGVTPWRHSKADCRVLSTPPVIIIQDLGSRLSTCTQRRKGRLYGKISKSFKCSKTVKKKKKWNYKQAAVPDESVCINRTIGAQGLGGATSVSSAQRKSPRVSRNSPHSSPSPWRTLSDPLCYTSRSSFASARCVLFPSHPAVSTEAWNP